MAERVYQHDPDRAPDSEFEPGLLAHLVVGNEGRLLDARRTPIRVVGLEPATGHVVVEITAFEDTGARWEIVFERVADFQFARGSLRATDDEIETMREAVERLDHTIVIDAAPNARRRTMARLDEERRMARDWLREADVHLDLDGREGDPTVFALLRGYLAAREVLDLDELFAERYVSNPNSGELIKGHRIVLAELGLVPYRGKAVRDPALFAMAWSAERRAAHVLARLAFVHEIYRRAGHERVELWRGLAMSQRRCARRSATFVSATFAREVAESLFGGGEDTVVAVLIRQLVPVDRLFMTFAETEAMSHRFHEAEAVVLADNANLAF